MPASAGAPSAQPSIASSASRISVTLPSGRQPRVQTPAPGRPGVMPDTLQPSVSLPQPPAPARAAQDRPTPSVPSRVSDSLSGAGASVASSGRAVSSSVAAPNIASEDDFGAFVAAEPSVPPPPKAAARPIPATASSAALGPLPSVAAQRPRGGLTPYPAPTIPASTRGGLAPYPAPQVPSSTRLSAGSSLSSQVAPETQRTGRLAGFGGGTVPAATNPVSRLVSLLGGRSSSQQAPAPSITRFQQGSAAGDSSPPPPPAASSADEWSTRAATSRSAACSSSAGAATLSSASAQSQTSISARREAPGAGVALQVSGLAEPAAATTVEAPSLGRIQLGTKKAARRGGSRAGAPSRPAPALTSRESYQDPASRVNFDISLAEQQTVVPTPAINQPATSSVTSKKIWDEGGLVGLVVELVQETLLRKVLSFPVFVY